MGQGSSQYKSFQNLNSKNQNSEIICVSTRETHFAQPFTLYDSLRDNETRRILDPEGTSSKYEGLLEVGGG